MCSITLLLTLLLSASNVYSADLKLNYSIFFGYMKTMYKLDYEHVTTNFYLVNKNSQQACQIENVEIVVDNRREKIDFNRNGQLRPFYSDEHRKDGATIKVTLLPAAPNQQCDLNVTVMAKSSELDMLTYAKMKLISSELEGVLQKNAGMIAKYFLPTFAGIRVELVAPLTTSEINNLDKRIKLENNGELLISNELLNSLKEDSPFTMKVKKITPWIIVD